VSKNFRQPPVFIVIALKNRKWIVLTEQPVLRPTAVRIIAEAWKAGHLARLRPVEKPKQHDETMAT
jgi:hypothetical protein